MSRKTVHEDQLSFGDLLPVWAEYSDLLTYRETGKRGYRDNHPDLLAYRDAFLDGWIEDNPQSRVAVLRDVYDALANYPDEAGTFYLSQQNNYSPIVRRADWLDDYEDWCRQNNYSAEAV